MCQGAFQHDAGVNGVRGAPRTEEEHWVLCVWRPAGEPRKSSICRPVSVLPRSDLDLFPPVHKELMVIHSGASSESPRGGFEMC